MLSDFENVDDKIEYVSTFTVIDDDHLITSVKKKHIHLGEFILKNIFKNFKYKIEAVLVDCFV